jgi:hypothetical protein
MIMAWTREQTCSCRTWVIRDGGRAGSNPAMSAIAPVATKFSIAAKCSETLDMDIGFVEILKRGPPCYRGTAYRLAGGGLEFLASAVFRIWLDIFVKENQLVQGAKGVRRR